MICGGDGVRGEPDRLRAARRARDEGIELVVCAPSNTERPPADRVKTDKRDAIPLARLLAAGELTLVTIPSIEREQLRDLVRCREDIRVDLMRARHRLGKFLLRREIYWEWPGETWSRKHRAWLASPRSPTRLAGDAGRLSARPRRADRPPAIKSRPTSRSSLGARRARTRSAGCGAYAGSTRSPHSGSVPPPASTRRRTRPTRPLTSPAPSWMKTQPTTWATSQSSRCGGSEPQRPIGFAQPE